MKKQKKQTLILIIVLLVLVGGYFLSRYIPTDTEDTTEEESEQVSVMDRDTVTDIYFNGTDGDVHLYKDSEDTWHVEGYDDEEVYTAAITACITGSVNLSIDEALDSTDYAEYGLDSAQVTANVKGTDGEHTIYYGDYNSAANVYYIMVDDDPTIYVYTHSQTLPFQHETTYYLDTDDEEDAEEATVETTEDTETEEASETSTEEASDTEEASEETSDTTDSSDASED